jgi:hypothetical protein
MIKQKSTGSLVAAVLLCLSVLISPVAANADALDGLTLTVAPSVTTASQGDNISYNYVITSTCNTTIDSLVLTDDKFGSISLPATSIATGENISASYEYTVAAADLPGPISNTATVTGVSSDNLTYSASAKSSVTLSTWIESILTKAGILRSRGVPGKGIDHAPGLQKPFNPNSHMGSDNSTVAGSNDNDQGNGNGHGKGNGNGNGKGKNK